MPINNTASITSPVNIIDVPMTISKVRGRFVYLHFNQNERSSPINSDLQDVADKIEPDFPDRFIEIKISSNSNVDNDIRDEILESIGGIDDESLIFSQYAFGGVGRNVYFAQDFVQGFVRISTENSKNIIESQKVSLDASNGSAGQNDKTLLSYIKKNASFGSYISGSLDDFEKALISSDSSTSDIIVIDPNTNMPIASTDIEEDNSSGNDSYVSAYYLSNILKKSKNSPIIRNISDRSIELASFITNNKISEKETRKLSNMNQSLKNAEASISFGTFQTNITGQNLKTYPDNVHLYHVGWHILKYEKNESYYNYKSSFFFPRGSQTEAHEEFPGAGDSFGLTTSDTYNVFKDPYVLYGKTYKYEIRDAYIGVTQDSSSFSGHMIIGTQSVNMEVLCEEKLPPPTPSSFQFEYVGSDMIRISWLKILKTVQEYPFTGGGDAVNTEVDDTAGYILFVRNSLENSYKIEKQFHIVSKLRNYGKMGPEENGVLVGPSVTVNNMLSNAGIAPNIIGTDVSSSNIVYVEDLRRQVYDLSIRSNTDYYIAFASYDVHGNIGNYSEQFFLRRNNVTGEVTTKIVSGKGASLQYPNTYIPTKFVLSSFKSSGYKYLDLFQTPDTSTSYPTNKSMSIHLIDLETESDVVITSTTS